MLFGAAFCFFEHVGSSGVFVAVEIVGAILGDVGAIAHDFDEFFGNLLHKQPSDQNQLAPRDS